MVKITQLIAVHIVSLKVHPFAFSVPRRQDALRTSSASTVHLSVVTAWCKFDRDYPLSFNHSLKRDCTKKFTDTVSRVSGKYALALPYSFFSPLALALYPKHPLKLILLLSRIVCSWPPSHRCIQAFQPRQLKLFGGLFLLSFNE